MAREPTARTEANVRRVLELSAKALELNDDLPYAHLMHGDQLANIGRVEAARGHWARCVDMAADGPEGRIAENRLQATE
jgi:predicted RNA polymerase sigma factor